MDDDLRTLERRAAADPTLQPLLRKARERAGLGRSLELRSVEADERAHAVDAGARAVVRLRDGRRAHAAAMTHALRSWVSGAFADHPGLQELLVVWRLHEHTDRPWSLGLRVLVPAAPRNAVHPDDARALEVELQRFAHLFPSRHHLFGGRRLRRAGRGDPRVVVDDAPEEDRRSDELEQVVERHVPFRLVEDLGPGLEPARDALLADGVSALVPRPPAGTRAGAARLADGAEADLQDDEVEHLTAVAEVWDRFVTALFAEHRELRLFAVRGWTSGYNDNWHEEHDQELYVSAESLTWLAEDWTGSLPPEVTREVEALAGVPLVPGLLDALRSGLERDFDQSVFGPFLRLRHGHDWLLVVRRDGDHAVERLFLRPEAPRP